MADSVARHLPPVCVRAGVIVLALARRPLRAVEVSEVRAGLLVILTAEHWPTVTRQLQVVVHLW